MAVGKKVVAQNIVTLGWVQLRSGCKTLSAKDCRQRSRSCRKFSPGNFACCTVVSTFCRALAEFLQTMFCSPSLTSSGLNFRRQVNQDRADRLARVRQDQEAKRVAAETETEILESRIPELEEEEMRCLNFFFSSASYNYGSKFLE